MNLSESAFVVYLNCAFLVSAILMTDGFFFSSGTPISLADSIQRNLIDSDTGKIFESKLKQLNIAVPNQFMSSRSARNAPINFEDALKV